VTSNPVVMRSVIRSIWQDLCDGVEEMGAKAASAVALGLAIIFAVSGLQPIAQASTPTRAITPIVVNAKAVSSPYANFPKLINYEIGDSKWRTWTWDKTAYRPSLVDPTRALPLKAQVTFACIRYAESRNHPNDTNQQSGAEGLYQFLPYLWQYGAKALGIKAVSANNATPEQQSAVAVWYYKRNAGFYPEWVDGCTG